MARKLYGGKDIEPKCEYCANGDKSEDGTLIFCERKGILPPDYKCKKFKYDPLMRVPKVAPKLDEYSPDDFKL
ncbi:MAG: hypothetical protein ACI396_05035 [Acutalibacteraceae bacterium]